MKHVPLAGGTSGILGTVTFFSGTTSLGTSGTLAGGTCGFLRTTGGTFFSGTTSLGTLGTLKDISSF